MKTFKVLLSTLGQSSDMLRFTTLEGIITADRCEVGSEGELGLFVGDQLVKLYAPGRWLEVEVTEKGETK